MEWVRGGVTAPEGFLSSGVRSGIKQFARDLGLLYSQIPATAAAVFTKSRLQGAPLVITREHLKQGRLQAVIANSGNANCCTGKRGLSDAKRMALLAAKALGIPRRWVGVCSTGLIGEFLPMERIARKIPVLVSDLNRKRHLEFAESILTTDKKIKEASLRFRLGKRICHIGAVCKGSGMIHPQMATMLGFFTTDVAVKRTLLQSVLRESVEVTFNRITVDGDTSPNDMVLILANGFSGAEPLTSAGQAAFKRFEKGLLELMELLARKLVEDGEGATRIAQVKVTGARSDAQALRACRFVANSNLVKTALYGRDPNWGRVAASVGASGAFFSPNRLSIAFGGVSCVRRGNPVPGTLRRLKQKAEQSPLEIRVDLGAGKGKASMWSSDLSEEYVRINAHYRT